MTLHGTKRLTAKQKRMREFEEVAYQCLREYQRGDFTASSGFVVGQLDVALTTVNDTIKAAAERIVK